MKTKLLFIAIALCLASYSSPLSAKEDKNTEVILIADGDTIICEKVILEKYGWKDIIKAYNGETIISDSIVVKKGPITNETCTVTYIYLKKEGSKVVESTSTTITKSKKDWILICFSFGFIIILCFLFFIKWVD